MGMVDINIFGDTLRQPAECIIEVDDTEIKEMYPWLISVSVEMSRDKPAEFTLVLDSIRDESGTWSVQDQDIFEPWKKIKIKASFGSYSEDIIIGYIKDVNAEYPENMGQAKVTVTGLDESVLLDREHVSKPRSTEEKPETDGAIATTIADEHQLDAETEDGITNNSLNQDDTDIKFLKKRAEANGFEFYIRDGKLYFGTMKLDEEPQPLIMVYAGRSTNCVNFSVKFDGHKPDEVQIVRGADEGTGQDEETLAPDLPLMGNDPIDSSNKSLKPFVWQMRNAHGSTYDEVRARAQAKANENSFKLRGTGKLDGSLYQHVLLTQKTVHIDGIGDTYNGLYYVDQVTHRFSKEGYFQEFQVIRNSTGDNIPPGAGGMFGGL